MVICLERGADLHMAQLMPLPLTVSCFSKIEIGFTFLVPAYLGIVPGKRPLNVCVCVCVCDLSLDAVTRSFAEETVCEIERRPVAVAVATVAATARYRVLRSINVTHRQR